MTLFGGSLKYFFLFIGGVGSIVIASVEAQLAKVSIIVMPSEEVDIGPIRLLVRKAKPLAVQTQVLLAVVKNLLDFLAYGKFEVFADCRVSSIKNRVDVFSK